MAWGFVWVFLLRWIFFVRVLFLCVFFCFVVVVCLFVCEVTFFVWFGSFFLFGWVFFCGRWWTLSTAAHLLKSRLMFIFCCAVGWNCFTMDKQSVNKNKKTLLHGVSGLQAKRVKLRRNYAQVGCCRELDIHSSAF